MSDIHNITQISAAHEKLARRLVDQCGRRFRILYRKLNKCKFKVLTG